MPCKDFIHNHQNPDEGRFDDNSYADRILTARKKCKAHLADQVSDGYNARAAADGSVTWYDPGNPSAGPGSYPGGTLWDYFNQTKPNGWGTDPYYAGARKILNDSLTTIDPNNRQYKQVYEDKGGDPDSTGTQTFQTDADEMSYDNTFKLATDPAALTKYIDDNYKLIVVSKVVGDNRFANNFPPEGFKDPLAGTPGTADAKARAAALKKADDKARAAFEAKKSAVAAAIKRARTLGFREQCFLLSQIVPITRYKVEELEVKAANAIKAKGSTELIENQHPPKTRPYTSHDAIDGSTNACIMVQGDPFDFMNRLTVDPGQHELVTMSTGEIANLQPTVDFYKLMPAEPSKNKSTFSASHFISVPIEFDTSFTKENLKSLTTAVQSKRKRGYGVGIKNFDVKFIGTNPFAAKRDLTAQLTIFANSFSDLLKIRGPKGKSYRYIDLALKTISDPQIIQKYEGVNSKDAQQMDDNLDSLDFTIRASVGFQVPPKAITGVNQAALRNNRITIDMTPTTHEFNFNPDGTLEFVVNFKPWISEAFSAQQYDIFSDPALHALTLESILRLDQIRQTCGTKTIAAFKADQMKDIDKIRPQAISAMTRRLTKTNRLKYLYLPNHLLAKINKEGPLFEMSELDKAKWAVMSEERRRKKIKKKKVKKKDAKAITAESITLNQNELPFVYVSDLIDTVLEGIDTRLSPDAHETIMKMVEKKATGRKGWAEKSTFKELSQGLKEKNAAEYKNFQKLRVVLGPIELVNPVNPADILIANLGDIPLSLKYLVEFLTSETLKKNLYKYPLNVFLNNLINSVLKNFLNDDTCFKAMVKQRTQLRRATFVGYQKYPGDSDDLTNLMTRQIIAKYKERSILLVSTPGSPTRMRKELIKDSLGFTRLYPALFKGALYSPLLNVHGAGKPLNHPTHNYMVFSTGRTPPVDLYQGDYNADVKRGVMHYSIGRDRGIIKDLKLVRDKRKYIAETRFAQEGYDGLKQLRETYSIEARLVGNFGLWPGQKIYVDPQGWVPSLDEELSKIFSGPAGLTQFGIGGYYDVMQVEHSLSPGKFETSFTAKWTAQIETPTTTDGAQGNKPNETPKGVQKCSYNQVVEKKGPSPNNTPTNVSQVVPEISKARQQALYKSNYPPGSAEYVNGMPDPTQNPGQ